MSDRRRTGSGSRWLMIGAALVVVLAGLKAAQTLVIPFLLAMFLAIISTPAVTWMTRRRVPLSLAVLIVLIVVVAGFSAFGAIVGGSVNEFAAYASQYQARFDGLVTKGLTWLETKNFDTEGLDLLNIVQPGRLMNLLGGLLKNLASVLSNLFLILLTMIFMLLEAATFPTKMRAAIGSGRFNYDNLGQFVTQVQHYLGLKTLTSLTTGVLAGVWTGVFGLDFAVVWGLLAFLLNYIPSIGSIVAAVPPVMFALVQGGVGYAVLIMAGYVVINVGIGNFIEPVLMGKTLGLSTLVVFTSLVFWGWMWGSIGMLLSVPLTMIIKIFLENTDDLQWFAVLLDSRRAAENRLAAAEAAEVAEDG